jgi:hypothetical protein
VRSPMTAGSCDRKVTRCLQNSCPDRVPRWNAGTYSREYLSENWTRSSNWTPASRMEFSYWGLTLAGQQLNKYSAHQGTCKLAVVVQ